MVVPLPACDSHRVRGMRSFLLLVSMCGILAAGCRSQQPQTQQPRGSQIGQSTAPLPPDNNTPLAPPDEPVEGAREGVPISPPSPQPDTAPTPPAQPGDVGSPVSPGPMGSPDAGVPVVPDAGDSPNASPDAGVAPTPDPIP
jgi:hypothetical protein